MQKPKVSVILVHYGKKKILSDCIKSIYSSKPKISFEIIVIDNNTENRGYAKGNNLGVKKANGEYVLILNPDTLIQKNSIETLVKFLNKNKRTGIVAPTLYDQNGEKRPLQGTKELTPLRGIFVLSFLNKIFPNNPIARGYWLKDTDRSKPFEASVVPGTAYMMKKSLFEKIGGLDENFFLYFEESDFCRRIKNQGYKLFIIPESKITHFWGKSTIQNKKTKGIFKKSRFYYFRKNFGLISALTVELFARLNKWNITFIAILALGSFLRFYRLIPNLILNGEMGTDYMNIWNIIHGTRTWLIGPRTSHEWFFIPPISYWVYVVLLFYAKYNPIVVNIFWALVGSFSILVCYYYVKRLFGEKIAIVSSFLLAVSPAWIQLTRDSRYNAPAGIIFFPYLWYLQKSIKDKGKSLGVLGFILGLSMSFFPSPFLLIPASIVSFAFYEVRPKLKYFLYFILGFLIPNITFVIYDASNKFQITLQTLAWIPYRILGFFGLYHKNTVSSVVLAQNVSSIYQFFADSFVPGSSTLSIILFVLITIGSVVWFIKSLRNKNKEMALIIVMINLVIPYLGLFVHGDPPEHYYLVIFPIPLILGAYLLIKFFKNRFVLVLLTLFIGVAGIWNLVSTNWFYRDGTPPFAVQLKVADEILLDSKGADFSIARIGLNDQFENDFANNYIYLLTIRGAKIDTGANIRYTIVEERNSKIPSGKKIWDMDGVQIYKLSNEKLFTYILK